MCAARRHYSLKLQISAPTIQRKLTNIRNTGAAIVALVIRMRHANPRRPRQIRRPDQLCLLN
jgi:hypothetical protein